MFPTFSPQLGSHISFTPLARPRVLNVLEITFMENRKPQFKSFLSKFTDQELYTRSFAFHKTKNTSLMRKKKEIARAVSPRSNNPVVNRLRKNSDPKTDRLPVSLHSLAHVHLCTFRQLMKIYSWAIYLRAIWSPSFSQTNFSTTSVIFCNVYLVLFWPSGRHGSMSTKNLTTQPLSSSDRLKKFSPSF